MGNINLCKEENSGIIVPLITPLKENGDLDFEGLERLINHVVDGGVHGVFLLGTTGEGPCLCREKKSALIQHAAAYLKNRTKLFVGITDTSPEETLKVAHMAADQGADVLVVAPPPYFPFTQDELYDYTRYIVRNSPLPVMLYNIPKMTKTSFEVETIDRLTDEEKIVGVKDSSMDMDYFRKLLAVTKKRSDWSVLNGYEILLAESMEAGGDGGVLGGGNVYPQLLVRFYKAITETNREEVEEIERLLSESRKMYSLGSGATSAMQAIKYALEVKGICGRTMALPFKSIDDVSGEQIRAIIGGSSDYI